MENRNLGVLFLVISFVFLFFLITFNVDLSGKSVALGCNPNEQCRSVSELITLTNIGFGFFGFMLALGFYILFFNKTEEKIMQRLEDTKVKEVAEEKLQIILKALDDYEKKVFSAVKEQEGITQQTLRLRANLSKAKLSYVLQELEKRNLVRRVPKGKTLEVYSIA